MKLKDLICEQGCKWAVITVENGDEVTFTLNADGSFYILNQDGGALQDTEREWYNDNWDNKNAIRQLRKIEKDIKRK